MVSTDGTETHSCEPAAANGCDQFDIADCGCPEIAWSACERGEVRLRVRE